MTKKIFDSDGFTLPEVLVVLVLSGFFVSLIFSFTFGYWKYAYLLEADLDTYVSRLNAGDFLRDNFNASSGLIIQNSIADNHTLAPDPAIASNLYWKPLHAIPGNKPIGNSGTTTPIMYFKKPSINSTGGFIMNGVQPYEDEFVLYLDGSTKKLMIRSLANPSATNNKLKTSCPLAAATSSCPADKTIIDNIKSIDLRYFSRTANLIDYSSISDAFGNYIGPDYSVVEVIEITLNVEKKPIFQNTNATKSSTIIRIALRNT